MVAEDNVSRDEHRADLAELRLEVANSLASLDKRTELIAQDLGALRREMTERFDRTGDQMSELRQDMRNLQQNMQTLNSAVQRQMWALIAVVVGAAIKVLFFP